MEFMKLNASKLLNTSVKLVLAGSSGGYIDREVAEFRVKG